MNNTLVAATLCILLFASRAGLGQETVPPAMRISDMGGTGVTVFDATGPAIAYNSRARQYLVVWSGNDDLVGMALAEQEIYGQRIDAATGQEVGANDFRISDMGGSGSADFLAFAPAVVYNPLSDEYLVVWAGSDDVGTLSADELEIFGQRLDTAGQEVGANDFRISDMGPVGDGIALAPAVAHDTLGNQYLVVWEGADGSAGQDGLEFEIFGQRLDAAAQEVGANDFRISVMGGSGNSEFGAHDPGVAYADAANHFLVVWSGNDDRGALHPEEFEIWGQLVVGGTGGLAGADLRISDMGPSGGSYYFTTGTGLAGYPAFDPAVVHSPDAGEFLVVWRGVGAAVATTGFEVFAQRLDAFTGAEVGANDFRVSDMGGDGAGGAAIAPAAAYAARQGRYLITWAGNDDGLEAAEIEVYYQLLDATTGAEVLGNDHRLSSMGGTGDPDFDAFDPAVAYGAGSDAVLVAWQGDDASGGLFDDEFEIFATVVGSPPIFDDGFESGDTSAWTTAGQ